MASGGSDGVFLDVNFMKSLHGVSLGHPGRVLGAPGAVLGGPWGLPGRSQATFWVPRSDPDDKGARSGGSWGGLGGSKNRPKVIFLRFRGSKCSVQLF